MDTSTEPTAPQQEGVWIRYCTEHQWLSPTYYRYDDVVASHGVHGRGVQGCRPGTIGRLELGTPAAVVADRLPEWARQAYWGTVVERFFDQELGAAVSDVT